MGPSGGPIAGAGFGLTLGAAGTVMVGAGRYYVAGVLVENDSDVALTAQPDPPGGLPPTGAGLHLAYLDVWDRHVTALDDPTIREVALGGPDTATRAGTVWQVRTQPLPAGDANHSAAVSAAIRALARARTVGNRAAAAAALQALRNLAAGASCAAPLEPLGGSLEAGTGTMAARTTEATHAVDPCRFDPTGAGYTRLENRLYRVEVHDPGTAATFKWSRDNGSVVVSIEEFRDTGGGSQTTELVVRRLGLDETQELKQDDWIEIVSDDLIARGEPGQLVQIAQQPDPANRILFLSDPVEIKAPGLHPQVRRWDLPVGGLATVRRSWQELEAGIEVSFGGGNYHTGDYWVIPARANTADVEWPPLPEYPGHVPTGDPEQLAPRGIVHWRAPLAALVHDGTRIVASIDLRALFPAATDLMDFAYVGGDGQEPELPSGHVPQPLQVAVTKGTGPVAGVLVRFTAESSRPATDTLPALARPASLSMSRPDPTASRPSIGRLIGRSSTIGSSPGCSTTARRRPGRRSSSRRGSTTSSTTWAATARRACRARRSSPFERGSRPAAGRSWARPSGSPASRRMAPGRPSRLDRPMPTASRSAPGRLTLRCPCSGCWPSCSTQPAPRPQGAAHLHREPQPRDPCRLHPRRRLCRSGDRDDRAGCARPALPTPRRVATAPTRSVRATTSPPAGPRSRRPASTTARSALPKGRGSSLSRCGSFANGTSRSTAMAGRVSWSPAGRDRVPVRGCDSVTFTDMRWRRGGRRSGTALAGL